MRKPQPLLTCLRRKQIVDAAVAVIAAQGIQNLSLSEIENKAGMKRGQLTYYFPTKEDILLAVFDRVLQQMCERIGQGEEQGGLPPPPESGWELTRALLSMVLTRPLANPEFGSLQYTFLAQMGHREDFRQRLANLYEEWRSGMAQGLANDHAQGRTSRATAPRLMATFIQALIHGLVMQSLADPKAFEGQEMLAFSLDVLGVYLGTNQSTAPKPSGRPGRRRAAAAR
jgi:AcrR family transcriptional regulator